MSGTEIRKENSITKLAVIGGKVTVVTEPTDEEKFALWLNEERFT